MLAILTGTNSYRLQAELRRLTAGFVAEHGDTADMGIERLDGEEASFERIQEALQSLPFLAERKMVVLLKPGLNKQFAEQAEKLLGELPDTTDLIIVEPKLDKRLGYYKFLKKQKGYQEFGELDEGGLAKWLVSAAKEQGAALTQADARFLIERAGPDQQKLAHEIEKLSLYSDTITRDDITNLTAATPQSKIFDLLDAAFAGNTRRAIELYGEQRAQKVEPQQIIAMLTWQLHVLALIKAAGSGRLPDTIARDARISPYVVRKSAGVARGLTMARVRQLIGDLLTIDERLKRESLDADDVLLDYLMYLSE